ncbi:MAG TPA: glutamate--tRNA ligase [Vicinamibacterales bacterium]|nr:glutamate--tRNA ligase [Vicinamibacterales bacterium]
MIRVRFAPSPTGYLHVGGARTALFNWLYARRHGGTFVLRIEDTDAERSSWEMVSGIVDGLRWLGLDWDEGPDIGGPHAPYFQSQRLEKYRDAAARLVAQGSAYYCYCTPELLRQKRQAAEAAGGGWVYDRTCCALTPDDIAAREADNVPRAVRFKVPQGTTSFADLVHGPIEFPNAVIEDFVVLRSDAQPTYHLSVVVDDIDMRISHVVRGDDHISNTPKQVLLYGAFGSAPPAFAHVPLILGIDKKRLSKRHGATSVMEYQRLGYLPEAMVNFLALLGWSPGGDQELFTREQLIATFALDGISGGNAVFNPEKLDWVNQQHIQRLPTEELGRRLEPALRAAGLWSEDLLSVRREWFLAAIELFKPRIRTLDQFAQEARPLFANDLAFEADAVAKYLRPEIREPLAALSEAFAALDAFTATHLETTLRSFAESRQIKAAALIHATRVAVTGRAVSPGIFEMLELIGRDRAVERMRTAVALVTPLR